MHQTRAKVSKRIPIQRKGTKYVVRPLGSLQNSVPVLIALRDMLKLAQNKKEVEDMMKRKIIKINNQEVKDYREPVLLFNILEADRSYV